MPMKDSMVFTIGFLFFLLFTNIFFVWEHERVHELSCIYFGGKADIDFNLLQPHTKCLMPHENAQYSIMAATVNDSIGYQLLAGIDMLMLLLWFMFYMYLQRAERGKHL